MKILHAGSGIALALALATAAPALAEGRAHASLEGRWALDVARMSQPPEARPKAVTIAFDDAGDGTWRMDVEIVDAAGDAVRMGTDLPTDGSPVAFERNPEADSAAMRMTSPGAMVLGLGREGIPASTRVYSVSDDGNAMTEVASYLDAAGKPLLRVNHFMRIRAGVDQSGL